MRYLVPTFSISVFALNILAFSLLRQEHFSAGFEMLNIFGHIESWDLSVYYQKAVYFLLLRNYVSLLSLQIYLFIYFLFMNLMNNGQMDRGNETPTQDLP